jgi:hypothetical protein
MTFSNPFKALPKNSVVALVGAALVSACAMTPDGKLYTPARDIPTMYNILPFSIVTVAKTPGNKDNPFVAECTIPPELGQGIERKALDGSTVFTSITGENSVHVTIHYASDGRRVSADSDPYNGTVINLIRPDPTSELENQKIATESKDVVSNVASNTLNRFLYAEAGRGILPRFCPSAPSPSGYPQGRPMTPQGPYYN